ncbi:MAG: hypothetical protein K6G61_03240 [Solobacterium sp.]|nr:hypothetical protein [Solobacterium sp.]
MPDFGMQGTAARAENADAINSMDNSRLVSCLANGCTFMRFNTARAYLAEIC